MKDQTLNSWDTNAAEWIKLITRGGIASRQVTNPAIIAFAEAHGSGRHLDLGCGEGWLSRALHDRGREIMGVDGTAALVESARQQHSGIDYHHVTYEQIIAGEAEALDKYSTILLNYCLYQKEETEQLLSALHRHLSDEGRVLIQTVHPYFLAERGEYQSQWIDNAWSGLPGDFVGEHSWYCRTMTDWHRLITDSGYQIMAMSETTSVDTHLPISILFCLQPS